MEIKYDVPIEVTSRKYVEIMRMFSGCVAGRTENGKYYIKVWFMKYADMIKKQLEK